MKSDKRLDETPAINTTPAGLTIGKLRRDQGISRYREEFRSGKLDDDNVHSSIRTEFLQLAFGNGISQTSRIMAWDNQRIFGSDPQARGSEENGDLEVE